ncbi:immunoglobulin-like domain-containing protein [Clostridium sp. C8-1-8]|uniref:immunoglobulin-like domain-containing protein n=1 Tax=Clostridium sp. C8-1-8 TaxID=2698831 RepID=UPI001371DFBF|nr:immunoglobulin-like domain-containing protein [Clostridium sp. C8-1-8]
MNYRSKSFRKALGICFSLIMVIGLVSFFGIKAKAVQALINTMTSSKFAVTIGNVQGSVGDVVEVPVSIGKPGSGIASYGMQINYDPATFEVMDITNKYGESSSFWSNFDNTSGYLKAAWVDTTAGDKTINSAAELYSVKIKIKSNNLGDKALTIDESSPNNLLFTDALGKGLGTEVAEGKVTVIKSDTQLVEEAKNALQIGYAYGDSASKVSKDITLPTAGANGVTVSWSSNKADVINVAGKVVRPTYANGDASLTLTATLIKNNIKETVDFNLNVIKNNPSTNANLKGLTINKGTLSPIFNSATLKFNVDVDNSVSSIVVNPVLDDNLASVTINGKASQDDVALKTGANTINIVVTAQDNTTKKQYVLVVNKSDIKKEVINADVETGNIGGGSSVTKTTITRTTTSDGVVKDNVNITEGNAKEAAKKAVENGYTNVRLSVPDADDKVSEVYVGAPKEALTEILKNKLDLEVYTENGRIIVPNSSLTNFNDDLYFRIVPIKQASEIKSVKDRLQDASEIKKYANSNTVEVIGRPMTIETNMENRTVTLVLPLPDSITKDSKDILNNLAVYVEHHDGTKELIKGKVVSYKNGDKLGLEFTINKFSSFTLVSAKGLDQTPASNTTTGTDTSNGSSNTNAGSNNTNSNTSDLPKTGGVSTRDYTILGIFIILAGGVMLYSNKIKSMRK